MFRKTITVATIVAAGVTVVPGAAQAAPVQAAVKLEATAVVNADKAVDLARSNARKAGQAVARSEQAMQRAYRITLDEGRAASVKFSAAAEAQGESLAAVVERSQGRLKAKAADALAETGRMEATLVARLADELERADRASDEQGEAAGAMGDDHASLTAEIAVTASEEKLRDALQRELDTVTRKSVEAQTRLASAVSELRKRSEGESQASMAKAESSLEENVTDVVAALRRGGRWDVSYEKTVGSEGDPVQVTVAARGHVSVGQGGRR